MPSSLSTGRLATMGTPGLPTLTILTIRSFSMTISTGPRGGAPSPVTTVTPRRINCKYGPTPSSEPLFGALAPGAAAAWRVISRATVKVSIWRIIMALNYSADTLAHSLLKPNCSKSNLRLSDSTAFWRSVTPDHKCQTDLQTVDLLQKTLEPRHKPALKINSLNCHQAQRYQ